MQKIAVHIEIIQFCRFYNRVPHHTCFGALVRIGEEPVFPADNERLNRTLGAVIRKLKPAVKQERLKLFFVVPEICVAFCRNC